jgi:N-acetylneuraminic acid mutarotase
VDIYDLNANTWSTSLLSEEKMYFTAVTANNKIYFAGGETHGTPTCNGSPFYASGRIDIYDNATNTWSTSFMQEGKVGFAAIEVAGKIYWAGGSTGNGCTYHESCVVEIKDAITGNSSIQQLSAPASWDNDEGQNAVVKNGKIVFMGDHQPDTNKFDIYDIATNSWSIGVLPVIFGGVSIISVNNIIYVAGGRVNGVWSNQVWKLEF